MTPIRLGLVLAASCVLSAGIGSGITLLAKTGPEGPQGSSGARGLRGPRGFEGPEGYIDPDEFDRSGLEAEDAELREDIESGESETQNLESQLADVESTLSNLCFEFNASC